MFRRLILALCASTFALTCGCGEPAKTENPNNLEYSKDGPPKRDGPPGLKKTR